MESCRKILTLEILQSPGRYHSFVSLPALSAALSPFTDNLEETQKIYSMFMRGA